MASLSEQAMIGVNGRRRIVGARNRVAGQSTVLFLMLVGVLALGLLLLFDTGQSVNKKVRLTNTADAAAYSVAVQQARVMNYAAYMNRGRVANEVAIAQLVSIWSWMNMLHTHVVAGYNLFYSLSYVPYVNVVARPLATFYQAAEAVAGTMRNVYRPIASGAIGVVDELNGLYATSSDAMLQLGGTFDGIKVAEEVVRKNDPTAEIVPMGKVLLLAQLRKAASAGSGDLLARSTRSGTRNAGMDRYRNVVMASRDRFTADRRDEIGVPFIDIETSGGTDLVDYDRWVGMDTLDLSIGMDVFSLDAPLGWGGAQAVPGGRNQAFYPGIMSGGRNARSAGWFNEYHSPANRTLPQYGGVNDQSPSGSLAGQYPSVDTPFPERPTGSFNNRENAYFTGYNGLRSYYDVQSSYGQTPEGDKAGPMFAVYVQSARENARTSQDIQGIGGPGAGQLELKNEMAGEKMTAIATAQTYFNRPPSSSLFRRLAPRSWNGNPQADTRPRNSTA